MEQKAKATPSAASVRVPTSGVARSGGGSGGAGPPTPAPPTLSPQALEAAQARRQATDPNDPGVKAQAQQLHALLERLTVREETTGSPATTLLGVDHAADLRLGSSRQLVSGGGGFFPDPRYASLDAAVGEVRAALVRLKAGGTLSAVTQAYQTLYGTSLSAVLGERVRNPQVRAPLMALVPPPISEAKLTRDAFIEQLAVQYVYMDTPADALNASTDDGRRGSNPQAILGTFGYRAGPPISGRWGFQMRVFLPVTPGKPPIVAFRGTEGISFDMKKKPQGTLDTVIGDFAPAGVGYNQYRQNHALIKRNMDAAAGFGRMVITGHSLGGALAQIAATEFRDRVSEVVTFQSAAISGQDVDKMKAYNKANPGRAVQATHYRVDGDVVPNAGEADLPGDVHYFDRMVRPRGTTAPYRVDLTADSADLTRAQGGHVSPILSTYLRGRGAQGAGQSTLVNRGLRDEGTLGPQGQDVQMVYGGAYRAERDPRIRLEPKRTSLVPGAMRLGGLYESVYYDQIAYNTLLAKVEDMAAGKTYPDYRTFRASAQGVVTALRGRGRLPLTAQDAALGQQLRLASTATDYGHPVPTPYGFPVYPLKDSPYTEMQKQGVLITASAADRVILELEAIWTSWHPEVAK